MYLVNRNSGNNFFGYSIYTEIPRYGYAVQVQSSSSNSLKVPIWYTLQRKIERETLGFVGSADSGRGCSACYSAKVTRYGAPLLSCVDSLCQFKQLERSQGGGGPLKLVCPVNLIKVRLSLRSSGKPTGLDMLTTGKP
ncbi:hypothetical protein G4B88_015612 [Cannabis sativa]|uniref:Uncharacterized protein n=1 Tax=Cannabis sativa TaxID=3483 RepID=A0A7J6H615_CANSA|nr:hypothetical protein G4B88_015612 [Cannabis sativa]